MSDLIPMPVATGAIITSAAEADAIRAFAENEKAASTRRAYRADFAAFSGWCRERGLCPLPADSQVVAWHISAIASLRRPMDWQQLRAERDTVLRVRRAAW